MYMQLLYRSFFLVVISICISCGSSRRAATINDDAKLEVTLVQVNDVYEIAPISGGTSGGMARVAMVKKNFAERNSNTLLVMAGDFLSPSVYNSLTYENKRIRGKQMIEVMNAAHTDIAVFGNHEFDITESELQERINESAFQWIASNTFHKRNGEARPFEKQAVTNTPFPETLILSFKDADGTQARIGFIGITIPFNTADYVAYSENTLATAEKLFNRIRDSCDAIVAITHQKIEDDILLAQRLPELAIIVGGHEHDMRFEQIGRVPITKAHANAKSAFIIKLVIDRSRKTATATAELKMLDVTVALEPVTDSIVAKWTRIADQNYASLGFDARKVIIASGDALDGRDRETRTQATNLTDLIVKAMVKACPESDLSIVNAGSIRLDDILYPPITQYDILRTLPFGGSIREAEVTGRLLLQVLEAGRSNVGTGGFLHYYPVQLRPLTSDPTQAQWTLHGEAIDSNKVYRVAFSEFLVSGREANLGFLNKDNPEMIKLHEADTAKRSPKSDIRLAIIQYLLTVNL